MSEPGTASEVQALLQQGNAALEAGNSYEARKYFRQVTEREPENVSGWLGLADSVLPYKDRQAYLQRAVELDPSHEEARARLQEVEARLAAGEVLAPPRKPAHPESGEPSDQPSSAETTTQYCANHPTRETNLHCSQCGKPICADCARSALVGQLCPECARERRPPNYQVSPRHLALAFLISFILSLVMSFLVVFFVFGLFILLIALFVAPAMAGLLVRLLDRVTHAKRGRAMQLAMGFGVASGALPLLILAQSLPLLLFSVVTIIAAAAQLR